MTDKMDTPIRHIDEAGTIYAAEIVPPERATGGSFEYGAKYHVDLVRTSVDDYGRGREQRLTVGQYNSWMEAAEQLNEVEDALEQDGVAGWGEDAERLSQQPFEEDMFYMTAVYPPDAPEDRDSAAQLLAVGESGIAGATLAVGERESVERAVDLLDGLGAEEGTDRLLEAAQIEAELNGGKSPATPLFNHEASAVRHIDGGGTAHWFAITERDKPGSEPYELRYFRALEMDDGVQRSDSYPVMPLPDADPGSAWALPGLVMYLEKGDVYMAQQFAHDVADVYGQDFPEPLDIPSLDPHPEYYFGYGVGPNNEPSLEAVKTWMDGTERRFDTLTVGEYGTFDEAAVDERELETLLEQKSIESALNLAESMAVTNGHLDPTRDDPRIFFDDSGPPDMFMTNRQRELNIPSYGLGAVSANGESFLDVMKSWGEDSYTRLVIPQPDWETAEANADVAGTLLETGRTQAAMRLVERAGVEAGVIDPERDDPRLFTQGPPDPFTTIREEEIDDSLARYGVTWRETQEWAQPTQPDVAGLEEVYHRLDVREAQTPEGEALGYSVVASAYPQLPTDFDDEEMDDTRYPTEAWALDVARFDKEPEARDFAADHSETPLTELAEAAVGESWQAWNMSDINHLMSGKPQVVDPAAWQPKPEADVNYPYWRLETLPVNDPEGEPLGHSLHMIVYDGVEHDPEMVGSPTIPEDEPYRMLEMAHFETTEAADRFGKEFNGYLMPGLLEGPELAEEVARLEGHPVEWKTLEGQELEDYRGLKLTLTRDPADWHPYNPNAERDARVAAEGLHTDPIYQFDTFNDGEVASKVEPTPLDLNL